MIDLATPWIAIRSFFESGGDVLWAIFAATIIMWTLIIERLWYFRKVLPLEIAAAHQEWTRRPDRTSWVSRKIRRQLISEISIAAKHNVSIIQVLMAILPLLGLLGTVTGMIGVFQVVASQGVGQATALADGISEALITTATGLAIAIPALAFYNYFAGKAEAMVLEMERLALEFVKSIVGQQKTARAESSVDVAVESEGAQ